MCWKSSAPKPSEGGAPACPPGSSVPCPLQCPAMEIEVNDTATADDDYVKLKCEHPSTRHRVPCRIRVTGAASADATVVLTNPDGRLRFPGPADRTLTLTVPANGSWVSFEVSGETGSAALRDAVIEAHCRTETGGVVATKGLTVFWFDDAHIDIAVGGNYAMSGNRLTVTAGNAVSYSARARIRPAGVNCAAAQVAEWQVGIMQNDVTMGLGTEAVWDRPAIAWNVGVAVGTVATVPVRMHRTRNLPVACNDVAATVAPLYDRPGVADTLDPNSLKPPTGCAGAAAASSFDTPSEPAPPTLAVPAQDATGANVGLVTYRRQKIRVIGRFRTWVAVFNTRSSDFCVLRQSSWSVNVDSSVAGAQTANAAGADSAVTADPVLAPTANTVVNDPANQFLGPDGAATVNFTR